MGIRSLRLVAVPAVALACATVHGTPNTPVDTGDRILITAAMIERSASVTAWDALKKLAPQLTYRERRDGQPTRLGRRGQSSSQPNGAPLVVLDGVRLADFRELDGIPATTIANIEILNGIDGTTYYGTNAGGGVILITTKDGTP